MFEPEVGALYAAWVPRYGDMHFLGVQSKRFAEVKLLFCPDYLHKQGDTFTYLRFSTAWDTHYEGKEDGPKKVGFVVSSSLRDKLDIVDEEQWSVPVGLKFVTGNLEDGLVMVALPEDFEEYYTF